MKENEGVNNNREQSGDNYLGMKGNEGFNNNEGRNEDDDLGINKNEEFINNEQNEDNYLGMKGNEGFINNEGRNEDDDLGINKNEEFINNEQNEDNYLGMKGNEGFNNNGGQSEDNNLGMKGNERFINNEGRNEDDDLGINKSEEFINNEQNEDNYLGMKGNEGFNNNGGQNGDNEESDENKEQNGDNKVGINETRRFDETYRDNYEKFGDHKYVSNKGQTEIEDENEKELSNNIREEELGEDNRNIINRENFIVENDKEKFNDSNIKSENLETNNEGRKFNNTKEELNENNEKTLKDFIIENEDNENIGESGKDKETKNRYFGIYSEGERNDDKNLARELIKDSKVDNREYLGGSDEYREFIDNNENKLYNNNRIESERYLKSGGEIDQEDEYDKSSNNSKEKLSEYEDIENEEYFRSNNENNKGVTDNSDEEIRNKDFEVESKDGENLTNSNLDKKLGDFTRDREKIGLDGDSHEDKGLKNNQEEKFVGNDVVHEKKLFGSYKEDKEDEDNRELVNNYIGQESRTHKKYSEDDNEETTGKEDKVLYDWDDLSNKATIIDGNQKIIGSNNKSIYEYVNDRETRKLDTEDLDLIKHEYKESEQNMNQGEYQSKSGKYKQEENINKEDNGKLEFGDQLAEVENNSGIEEFGESNVDTEKDGFLAPPENEKIHDNLEYVNQHAGIGDIGSNNNEYHNQITQIVNETPNNGDVVMSETDFVGYEPAFENENNKHLNMDDIQSIVDTEEITEYLPEENTLTTESHHLFDDFHNEKYRNVDKDELEFSKFNNGILKDIYETKDKRETGYIEEQGKEGIKDIQDNGFFKKVDDSLRSGYDNENLTNESHENSIISDIEYKKAGIENIIPEMGYNTNSLDNGGKIKEISIDKNIPSGSFVEQSSQRVIYDVPHNQNKMSDASIIHDSIPFQDLDLKTAINFTKEKQKKIKEMINETERHIKSIEPIESKSFIESINNEISQLKNEQENTREMINETEKQIKPLGVIESESLTKSIENEISQVRDKQKSIKEMINETERRIKSIEPIESKSVIESIKNAISQLKNEQENTKEMINKTKKQIKPLGLMESKSFIESIKNAISKLKTRQEYIRGMINETEKQIKPLGLMESKSFIESINNEISQLKNEQENTREMINETEKQIEPLELMESKSVIESIKNAISQLKNEQENTREMINETEKQIKPRGFIESKSLFSSDLHQNKLGRKVFRKPMSRLKQSISNMVSNSPKKKKLDTYIQPEISSYQKYISDEQIVNMIREEIQKLAEEKSFRVLSPKLKKLDEQQLKIKNMIGNLQVLNSKNKGERSLTSDIIAIEEEENNLQSLLNSIHNSLKLLITQNPELIDIELEEIPPTNYGQKIIIEEMSSKKSDSDISSILPSIDIVKDGQKKLKIEINDITKQLKYSSSNEVKSLSTSHKIPLNNYDGNNQLEIQQDQGPLLDKGEQSIQTFDSSPNNVQTSTDKLINDEVEHPINDLKNENLHDNKNEFELEDSKTQYYNTNEVPGQENNILEFEGNSYSDSSKKYVRGNLRGTREERLENDNNNSKRRRSLGTIREVEEAQNEREWIMKFPPKLKSSIMRKRPDLFTSEEIANAEREAANYL
ncbi:uncharacterized protein CMU_011830 [Cryptosporidium muris RN66]|uniref:Uncharacterized protein n=1 Tax=Cryptosporidium muris (strain RN66) TaxID=441375 RepID=B6AJ40_CRYMR|nr:uncharacterized protein CMU_011830 [Cryptosporidium muris RN66]EEA08231.1 hypothetical protein CMU_011830 [Cryptosporidium muris RN66]|eukprot:XP_002142580.1 hypothetical protein [Cryptosporidium muris RN66]